MRKPSLLIQHDEHASIGGVDGKKVFVIDNAGNQITDFGGEKLPTASNNPSLAISNDDTTVSSTMVITKTIGATNYTKTIGKNAAGDVVAISSWS